MKKQVTNDFSRKQNPKEKPNYTFICLKSQIGKHMKDFEKGRNCFKYFINQSLIVKPKSDGLMLVRVLIILFLDDRFRSKHADVFIVYEKVPHEKKERSPPSNKNIFVRNIKDQIANMSSTECTGFKSEYQVRISILIRSLFDEGYAMGNASYNMIYKESSFCKIYH